MSKATPDTEWLYSFAIAKLMLCRVPYAVHCIMLYCTLYYVLCYMLCI